MKGTASRKVDIEGGLPASRLGLEALEGLLLLGYTLTHKPITDCAHTLNRHVDGLFAFFDHRITSAGAEGLNSRIQAIRVSARGYRNRENFKTAIYFHLGLLPPRRP